MDARELRIGSKVNLNGADVTVKTIEYNPVSEEYFIRVLEDYRQIKVNYLSPIPITEELLLRAGFNKIGNKYYIGAEYEYSLNGVFNDHVAGCTFSVNILFLHQLQNLIYSLTGSELTFKQ